MIHYVDEYLINPTHQISVILIGAGGNGNQALIDLAKINACLLELGHPGLYVCVFDDDKVELSNIGRQRFSYQDLGLYKAEVLVTRINRFYGFDWDCKLERFNGSKYEGANIIISCVDNVTTRIDIANNFTKKSTAEYRNNLYWLDFGNGKDFGQFVLGSADIKQPKSDFTTQSKLKTVLELFPDMINHEDINEPSCSTREALMHQDLFINSILVSTGMNLLWKLFTDYKISYHGGFVNLKNMNMKPINL